MQSINLNEKLKLFNETWSHKVVGELNESYIKLVKLHGEFIWHAHENEDEMFFVIFGELTIKFEDKDVLIKPGEFIIIPKGVSHMPVAKDEVHVMLIEPKATLNTGDEVNEKTLKTFDFI